VAAYTTGLGGSEAIAYAIADNRTAELSEWDDDGLAAQVEALLADGVQVESLGWTEDELADLMADDYPTPDAEPVGLTLAERFIVPPFSVLDARQGYWQERKRAWLVLGIESELGRGGGGVAFDSQELLTAISRAKQSSTST
jgi:hypothetical protein